MHSNSMNSKITAAISKSGAVNETDFFFFMGFFIPILSPELGFPSSAESSSVLWTQPLRHVKIMLSIYTGY